MSSRKKGKPALNHTLYLTRQEQQLLTLRGRTPLTPTVISRSRLDLSNYPCTLESQHLRLVMCRSWTSIRQQQRGTGVDGRSYLVKRSADKMAIITSVKGGDWLSISAELQLLHSLAQLPPSDDLQIKHSMGTASPHVALTLNRAFAVTLAASSTFDDLQIIHSMRTASPHVALTLNRVTFAVTLAGPAPTFR
ncbi:hypothetical protein J6590_049224 [Homalodisca vitripennis]|nr:hypothetical protein J6590_049224 [Homalodisca vitripennis]